jgi:hypothetical protein
MDDLDLSKLVGCNVESIETWPGCSYAIRISGGYLLTVECLWRLRRDGRLALTSEDHGQLFGRKAPVDAVAELSQALASAPISHVDIANGTGDLTLHFGILTLELLSTSSGYEAWQLAGPNDFLVVAQGGGNLAVWLADA